MWQSCQAKQLTLQRPRRQQGGEMSPSVPISRFVDKETVEPSTPTESTVQPADNPTDQGATSQLEWAAQPRAQLECESLPPMDPADSERIDEASSDEAPRAKPETHNRTINRPRVLSAKQQRFIDEYLVDLNATQAAIRAGYSKRTARALGSETVK